MTLTEAADMNKGAYADIAFAIRKYGAHQFLKAVLDTEDF
jgi:hypothetical protein